MEKMKKSQILRLVLISALCIITPLLSASFRSKYLYFIVNILIIAVGVESGLASFFLKAPENKKPAEESTTTSNDVTNSIDPTTNKSVKVFKKFSSEKIDDTVKVLEKSPSTQSLFFIGGAADEEDCGEEDDVDDDDDDDDDDDGEEIGELSGQELYHKAETFIGDFYNQLKMQRDESMQKLHGIYQKAF